MNHRDASPRRALAPLLACLVGAIVVLGILAAYLSTTGGGRLQLRTTPSGAAVTVNGRLAGVTSDSGLVVDLADADTVTVVLSRAPYLADTSRVLVRRGELVMVDHVMRRAGMVFVRGGPFTMGDDGGAPSERPAHEVVLDPFYIDATEVTVEAYAALRPAYRAAFQGPRMPATNISWVEASAYCAEVGKRLPTEAEWERACRGPRGRAYAYGDDYDARLAHTGADLDAGPRRVGSFPPANAGAFDMTGNVWEWCADWYARDAYTTSPHDNPTGPATGERRALRGGAWYTNARFSRCAHRPGSFRSDRDVSFGFRCAADP